MRLIDVDALIKDLEYDVELDSRALEDTDLLLGRNRELVQFDKDCKQNAVVMLKNEPTVDAVPVIRCKDCKHYADECCDRYADETLGYAHSTQESGYCWVAERKEE